jgi:NTP pyrophosphatase (non-canonical NTP hydrolase)
MNEKRTGRERFDALVARLRMHNVKHGFVAPSNHRGRRNARATLSCLMLIVTELAEAAQEVRRGIPATDTFAVELADAFLRLLDLADAHGIDLIRASEIKMTLNENRPRRHGGKVL